MLLERSVALLLLLTLTIYASVTRAATVTLEFGNDSSEPIDRYELNIFGQVEELPGGPSGTYVLYDQGPGDYSATIQACNVAGCAGEASASWTIPDVPNVDGLFIRVTVTKD